MPRPRMRVLGLAMVVALLKPEPAMAHPLRLSLCQIEYSSQASTLTVSLRLFLTDVNEALVFDPIIFKIVKNAIKQIAVGLAGKSTKFSFSKSENHQNFFSTFRTFR